MATKVGNFLREQLGVGEPGLGNLGRIKSNFLSRAYYRPKEDEPDRARDTVRKVFGIDIPGQKTEGSIIKAARSFLKPQDTGYFQRGVYRGTVQPVAELATRTLLMGDYDRKYKDKAIETIRRLGADPEGSTEDQKSLSMMAGLASTAIPYVGVESAFLKGLSKVDKFGKILAKSKLASFGARRLADQFSGQTLAPGDTTPEQRVQQSVLDLVVPSALEGGGAVVGAGLRGTKKLAGIAGEQLAEPKPGFIQLPTGEQASRKEVKAILDKKFANLKEDKKLLVGEKADISSTKRSQNQLAREYKKDPDVFIDKYELAPEEPIKPISLEAKTQSNLEKTYTPPKFEGEPSGKVVKPEDIKAGEYLDAEDAIQATEFARQFGDEKTYKPIFNRFIGDSKAGDTKGALVGYKYQDIPLKNGFDIIDDLEGIGTKKVFSEESAALRQEFDSVRLQAEKDGIPIGYQENYITHIWKQSPAEVQKILSAKGGFKYAKERVIPTYREGIELGLTPKYTHPAPIIAEYVAKLEKTKAALSLFRSLKNQGIIVPAKLGASNIDFEPIVAGGFPKSVTDIGDGKTYIGEWYAPRKVAELINNAFSPKEGYKFLEYTANIARGVQDSALGGGIPFTSINYFTIVNSLKELTAGRGRAPFKALASTLTDAQSKKYFAQHADTVIKMQQNNVPITTSLNTDNLVPGALKKNIGQKGATLWNNMINTPTFKRFMPALQVDFFEGAEAAAIKAGKTPQEAIKIASDATMNFYGLVDTGTKAARYAKSPNTQNLISTVFFAPGYREAMINFWVKNVTAIGKPFAKENIANTTFLAGVVASYFMYDAVNRQTTGHGLQDNPTGTKDKILIPLPDGKVIGVPFLPSIITLPRQGYKIGANLLKGDVKDAVKESRFLTSAFVSPLLDVSSNQDYFGNPIVDDTDSAKQKLITQGLYIGARYAPSYVREGLNAAAGQLPEDIRKTIGAKEQPVYQTLSQAAEFPLRFYTEKSLRGREYYAVRDEVYKTLDEKEKQVFDLVYNTKTDDLEKTIFETSGEAAELLNRPSVLAAQTKINQMLRNRTGEPIDPLYDLPQDKQPVRIEYHYLDENKKVVKYFIEGEQLQFFQQNLMSSGSFCNIHNFKFLPVFWELE